MLDSLKQGIEALLRSRKFLTAVIGAIIIGVSVVFNVKPEILNTLQTLLLLIIGAWTVEDVAAKLFGGFSAKKK